MKIRRSGSLSREKRFRATGAFIQFFFQGSVISTGAPIPPIYGESIIFEGLFCSRLTESHPLLQSLFLRGFLLQDLSSSRTFSCFAQQLHGSSPERSITPATGISFLPRLLRNRVYRFISTRTSDRRRDPFPNYSAILVRGRLWSDGSAFIRTIPCTACSYERDDYAC